MRKVILQMNMSLDAFVADAHGKLEWMIPESDARHMQYLQELTDRTGSIILGRKMAVESIPHWEKVAEGKKSDPEYDYAHFFVNTEKIIFSKTLQSAIGKNAMVERGDLKERISSLKSKPGKDIMTYGGAGFVASLISQRLVDELHLFVHPIALGGGLPIFTTRSELTLIRSEQYSNGIVLYHYQSKISS